MLGGPPCCGRYTESCTTCSSTSCNTSSASASLWYDAGGPCGRRARIPWIAVGPGIRRGVDLTTYPKLEINTEDTFATVCWLPGIPVDPKNLDGKPMVEILDRKEFLMPASR